MKQTNSVLRLALGGIFAAAICISTLIFQIPISLTHGYIHLGDAVILLCAALTGWLSVSAAALGSLLADLLSGYAIYCIPSALIKGCMAALIALTIRTTTSTRTVCFWFLLSELWMVLGYFLAEWLLLGYGLPLASASVLTNLIQALSGIILSLLFLKPFRTIFARFSL